MQVSRQKKTRIAPRRPDVRRTARRRGACCGTLETCLDARLFKALADPTRLHILVCLAGCCRPQTVGQVAACCAVDLSVVSRHLALLRDSGILTVQKQGRSVLYSVRYADLAESLHALADALEGCCRA
ncbi:MAG: helix-turn-helix transcriptional regulator [Phycisphaerales bacterium]|nr:helix-turn-helix transcriptional regulator [Phycisphaerales bacterium]